MNMLTERLQILITKEQRLRLDAEAHHRQTTVGALVREAIDEKLGAVSAEDRVRAVDHLAGLRGRFIPVEEMNRIVEEEREAFIERRLGAG